MAGVGVTAGGVAGVGMAGPGAGGPSAGGPAGPGAQPGAAGEEGCPVGSSGCVSGHCESPPDPDSHKTVQLPDQTKTEPTKVIPTSEKQLATDVVDYRTTRHVWQPTERHHTTHKHRNLVRRHFTKVVYHPTFKRINRLIRTNSAEDQVMPTEEVVAPTVDHGCVDGNPPPPPPQPQPEPVRVIVPPPIYRAVPVPVYGHRFGW